jgi:hypothetical protein
MCMVDYGDRPEFYRTAMRRSRRPRRCEECSRSIAVGEEYQNAFMVYNGFGSTFFTCCHCIIGMRWLANNCGGFVHGVVWEDLEEHITEYRHLAFPLSKLKIGRQRLWRRFDGNGLMTIPAVPPSLEEVGLAHA